MDKYFFIALVEEACVAELSPLNKFNLDKQDLLGDFALRLVPIVLGGKVCEIVEVNDKGYCLSTTAKVVYSEFLFNKQLLEVREEKIRRIFSTLFEKTLAYNETQAKVDLKEDGGFYTIFVNFL